MATRGVTGAQANVLIKTLVMPPMMLVMQTVVDHAVGGGHGASDEIRSTKNIRGPGITDVDAENVGKLGEVGDTKEAETPRGPPRSRQCPRPTSKFDIATRQGSNREHGSIRAVKKIRETQVNTEIREVQILDP